MERKRLILLASPTLRRGPLSALQRFVRDYESFLSRFEIITTEGCQRALLRAGLLHNNPHFEAPMPGRDGGVVHLSYLVVAEPRRVEAVIYLIDPKDPSSIYPETNAMKRECVVHQVTFLSTSRAAREWAVMNWTGDPPQFATPKDVRGLRLIRPLEEETIALIAHDGKKAELLKFVCNHFDFLLRFNTRVATGTTGGLLNGILPKENRLREDEREELPLRHKELLNLIDSAKNARRIRNEFVDSKLSGPEGGDVLIARMVLDGSCQRIVFFENPKEPHEHTEDIQLLERTGRLRGKSTICIHDSKTAADFFQRWETSIDERTPPRMLLSFVLERLFGVKCVLVESADKTADTWEAIRHAAGWFMLSHIATLANDRRKLGAELRVSVSWGVGSSGVVDAMRTAMSILVDLDERRSNPAGDRDDLRDVAFYVPTDPDYPFEQSSLADPRYFHLNNVVVAPIQGLVGSEDESVEANEIAHRMKDLFRGTHVAVAANVLGKERGPDWLNTRCPGIDAHWSNTDVVLATAGPVSEVHKDRPRTTALSIITEEMKKHGACGDVGGLYLDHHGHPVRPTKFESRSMTHDQLKKVRARQGVIVVAGAEENRMEIVLAALRSGWISVLVTDTTFARGLVREVSKLVVDQKLRLGLPSANSPLIATAKV